MKYYSIVIITFFFQFLCIEQGSALQAEEKIPAGGTLPINLYDSNKSTILFLSKEEAAKAMIADSLDPYFERLQAMEISVKCGIEPKGRDIGELRNLCREAFKSNVLEFTDQEKKTLEYYISSIDPVLKNRYPSFTNRAWAFIKTNSNIEGGLPHTRDKYIILSEEFLRELDQASESGDPDAFFFFANILIHEKVHVCQRLNKAQFEQMYEAKWKFKKTGIMVSGRFLTEHQLINPDGTEAVWAYPVSMPDSVRYVVPSIILSEGEGRKKMPEDFRKIGLFLVQSGNNLVLKSDRTGNPVYTELSSVRTYIDAFPATEDNYHPNELSADIFARIATMDLIEGKYAVDKSRLEEFNVRFDKYRQDFKELFQ